MKRITILLFSIVLVLYTKHPIYAQMPKGQSLLWEISRDDLKEPSYIFGTIHVICKDDYLWTPIMQKKFNQCNQVCFEMDLDDPSIVMTIAASMLDNSGKQLQDYFTQEDYKKIATFVSDSLQINISMLQKMKPVALYSLFTSSSANCIETVSYENILLDKARQAKKHIIGIESAADQIALLNKIPTDTIIKEIVDIVNGREKTVDLYTTLYTAYKKQDINSISKLIADSSATSGYTYLFLEERNEKWIPQMMDMMEQGAIFFAVGAGHLTGEKGILSLLIEQGYTVSPVK